MGTKGKIFVFLSIIFLLAMAGGCTTSGQKFLPSSTEITKSPWESYEAASKTYNQIEPGKTTIADLQKINIDPFKNENIKILNYLTVQQRFMHNPNIKLEDLPEGVQYFINAREKGTVAYEIILQNIKNKREGNFFLDISKFKRNVRTTGWDFRGLILIVNEVVVYKLIPPEGIPKIDKSLKKHQPLGPLQEPESLVETGIGKAMGGISISY